MLTVERFGLFDDVPAGDWPAARDPAVFLTPEWTRSVEGALSREQAYLVCRDRRGRSIGTASLYFTTPDTWGYFDPAAVANQHVKELAQWIGAGDRRRAEECAVAIRAEPLVPAAIATVPFAFVHSVSSRGSPEVMERLVRELDAVAADAGASCTAVLYVEEGARELRDVLEDEGFTEVLVAANGVLPTEWDSLDDGYLRSLTRRRRKAIRRELRGFRSSGIELSHESIADNLDTLAHLQALLTGKYGLGYDVERERAAFVAAATHVEPYARLLVARRNGAFLGFQLYFEKSGLIHPKQGALDLSLVEKDDFLHFALVYYALVVEAIKRDVREIHYGVDGYETKVLRGCVLRNLYWYVKVPPAVAEPFAELAAIVSDARERAFAEIRALSPRKDAA